MLTKSEVISNDFLSNQDKYSYQKVYWLWILVLFAPAKVLFYYLPASRPLTWITELLLWWCLIDYFRYSLKKPGFPAMTAFMTLLIFGTVVAFFTGNWGVSREILRTFYQIWLLGIVTLAFCNTPERAQAILKLYLVSFLYYGIWGIISLKLSPLEDTIDPGGRVIVAWHPNFDNRDAFGPLMIAGFFYSIYYYQARLTTINFKTIVITLLSALFSFIGFITSFGRGVFLSALAGFSIAWLQSRKKLVMLTSFVCLLILINIFSPTLWNRYFSSMQTITDQNINAGTGQQRYIFWMLGLREFISSPLFGVGTGNFGIAAQHVIGPSEVLLDGETTREKIYGRAMHSAPMTILSEYGLIGVIVAIFLLVDFYKTNHLIRKLGISGKITKGFPKNYVKKMGQGLFVVFTVYLINGIFYEIIYTPLFWHVMIVNRMLYLTCKLPTEKAPS